MDLLRGNEARSEGTWTVDTLAHPSFVAMLFLAESTLYHQVLPLRWVETGSVRWLSTWYGQPCHPVLYPNGQQVCIACFNSKPDNAVFVFSANWFTTFQCKWVCRPGYAGPGCEVEMRLAVYVTGTLIAALMVAGMLVCLLGETQRAAKPEAPPANNAPMIQPVIEAPSGPRRKLDADGSIVFHRADTAASNMRIKFL